MSKAFTKEDHDDDEPPALPYEHIKKNYVTPDGFAALQQELRALYEQRPQIVETVRWAAGNGDRSENGDYIYGKKRLREIDKRLRYLTKRLESAEIVDPLLQKNLTKVFFGATVTFRTEDGAKKTVKLVGIDEADIAKDKVSWLSPLAKALLKAEIGDVVQFHTPEKKAKLVILAIKY